MGPGERRLHGVEEDGREVGHLAATAASGVPTATATAEATTLAAATAGGRELRAGEEMVLPVAEEVLRFGKRAVETGRVRIALTTETVPEILRETLRHRRAEVVRVPVEGLDTDAPPPTRQEGDTLVVPVVEELLVVTRRYRVREELRLRLTVAEEAVELPVERRVQRATVERLPPDHAPGAGARGAAAFSDAAE